MHIFFCTFLGVYGSLRSEFLRLLLSEKTAGKRRYEGEGKANEVR